MSESNKDESILDGAEPDKPMGEIDNIDIAVDDKDKEKKEEKILEALQTEQQSSEKKPEQTIEEMKKEFADL